MRKKIIGGVTERADERGWLDLEPIARVEVTSESDGHPIEAALVPGNEAGWKAKRSGAQKIRLVFDSPQALRRIRLEFNDQERVRTQEFVLRWLPDGEATWRELVRQQFNFSPAGTTREVDDYNVVLDGARALELEIIPDISGGDAVATLASLHLA